MPRGSSGGVARVLIETLRLGRFDKSVDLNEIASRARASESFTAGVLTNILGEVRDTRVSLSSTFRIRIAIEAARAGRLRDAALAISWQEFEEFAEECLAEAGFQTDKNVRVKGDGRAWQIDVVGIRGDLILTIDCKHWNTPGYLSKFKLAAEHQRMATLHFLARPVEKRIQGDNERLALPVILTLSEPRSQFFEGVVLVSVEKLPSFLSGVTPFDENLPFMSLPLSLVENPMSESKWDRLRGS